MENKIKLAILDKIRWVIFNLFGETALMKLQTVYWVERLKNHRFYENEIKLLPYFVHPGNITIDIGANFGQYTYPLSKLVGQTGRVISFEPVKYSLEILKNVVKKLKLTNVEIHNVALGEKGGEVDIITPVLNSGAPNTGESHLCVQKENKRSRQETVKITTLDKLMFELPLLNKVTFIKCDVEGAEMMVFKGGKALLSKCHPAILCEIEERHTKRYNYTPQALFIFLKNLGYRPFIFISDRLMPIQGIQESIINYIFIHGSFIHKYGNKNQIF